MTHVNVREVLESLTLAKEAYDAVPDLRRQIDDLQAAVASKDRMLETTHTELAQMIASKANVEAKLKQTEEERDAYGFRAIDAEEKLEKVFGVVKPATPPVQPQVSEVGQSATDPTKDGMSVTESKPIDPTVEEMAYAKGQSAVGPTSTTTGTTEPIGVTSPNQGFTETVARSAESPHWSGSTQHDSGDEDHIVVDKPYLGHPSWEKPHDMSWNEWESKGGTVPGWMKHNG